MAKKQVSTIGDKAALRFYSLVDQMQDERIKAPAKPNRMLTGQWTAKDSEIKRKWSGILRDQALLCAQLGVDLGEIGKQAAKYQPPEDSLFDSE